MKVYIAGPMTHLPDFNFPAFFRVAAICKARGWTVFNPAAHDLDVHPDLPGAPGFATGDITGIPMFDLRAAMQWDLERVLESDGVVMLPGWELSTGARYERAVAEATGKQIFLAVQCGASWSIAEDERSKQVTLAVVA